MTTVALHHAEHGRRDAPAVLLGGSLGTTSAIWDPQVPALSVDRRVIAFDHRGHGGSPAPAGPYTIAELGADVLALMDRLELQRAAYVGLSIGGMVGLWLAGHAPQRLSALVAVCTTARMDSAEPWRERAAGVRRAGSTREIADAVLARWFTDRYASSHPDVVAGCRGMIEATDPEGYAACCDAIAAHDVVDELSSVTVPTVVVSGAQDEAIPAAHGRRIAEAIPGARHVLLDPAAHIATVERADEVTALVVEHLGDGEAAP